MAYVWHDKQFFHPVAGRVKVTQNGQEYVVVGAIETIGIKLLLEHPTTEERHVAFLTAGAVKVPGKDFAKIQNALRTKSTPIHRTPGDCRAHGRLRPLTA